MRLRAVGCLSRSRVVFTLDMPISSRTTETDEEDDEEPDEAVSALRRLPSSLFRSKGRLGLASRSAFSRSRSTTSMVVHVGDEFAIGVETQEAQRCAEVRGGAQRWGGREEPGAESRYGIWSVLNDNWPGKLRQACDIRIVRVLKQASPLAFRKRRKYLP